MTFQPSPEQIQLLGILLVLTAVLQFAEKTWNLVRKITDYWDKRRRTRAKEKQSGVRAARSIEKAARNLPTAVGAEEFPKDGPLPKRIKRERKRSARTVQAQKSGNRVNRRVSI